MFAPRPRPLPRPRRVSTPSTLSLNSPVVATGASSRSARRAAAIAVHGARDRRCSDPLGAHRARSRFGSTARRRVFGHARRGALVRARALGFLFDDEANRAGEGRRALASWPAWRRGDAARRSPRRVADGPGRLAVSRPTLRASSTIGRRAAERKFAPSRGDAGARARPRTRRSTGSRPPAEGGGRRGDAAVHARSAMRAGAAAGLARELRDAVAGGASSRRQDARKRDRPRLDGLGAPTRMLTNRLAARSRCASSSLRRDSSTAENAQARSHYTRSTLEARARDRRARGALADDRIQLAREAYRRGHTPRRAALKRALELVPGLPRRAALPLGAATSRERYAERDLRVRSPVDDPTFPSPWRALTNRGWAEYKLGQRDGGARVARARARVPAHDYWPATLDLAILEGDAGRRARGDPRCTRRSSPRARARRSRRR